MSNVGASKITDDPVQPESTRMSEKVLREGLLQVLKKHFRPEFLSASMR
jgi:ATP-dependent Clp protease ATP-binding subunit ClpC